MSTAMTLVVTRNVPGRFRGFLASCMLELAPGVYGVVRMKKPVRDRVWSVMLEWSVALPEDGGVLMVWPDRDAPSGIALRMVGWPKKELHDHEGVWLARSSLTAAHDLSDLPPADAEES